MITFLFFVILGTVWMYHRETKFWQKVLSGIMGFFAGFFVGLLVAVGLGYMISAFTFEKNIYEPEIRYTKNIVSIQDNLSSNGSFFLGVGNVDGDMYYMYYTKENENEYRLNKIISEDVSIVIDSIPRVVNYIYAFKPPYFWWGISTKEKTAIHVPEGTIKQNYILDAK